MTISSRGLQRRITTLNEQTQKELAEIRENVQYFPGEVGEVSHFLFNEGAGHTHEEVSGNDGTVTGAVWGQDADGRFLSFDGVNDEVDFGATDDYHSGIAAIATWEIILKAQPPTTTIGIPWQQGSAAAGNDLTFSIETHTDNDVRHRGRQPAGGGTIWSVTCTGCLQWEALTHIRLTWEDGATPEQSLYVNDMATAQATASTGSGNLANTGVEELKFGVGSGGINFYKGKIYEAKIWSTVRSNQVLIL